MTHIILLLYLMAGLSGVGSMIYLITRYGRRSLFIRAYTGIHLSYTLLMLAALVVLYLRVNVIRSSAVMSVFVGVILLGQGFLCRSLSGFSRIAAGDRHPARPLWNLIPLFYGGLAAVHIFLRDSRLSVIPVIAGVVFFMAATLIFFRKNSKTDKNESREDRRVWFIFFLFTLLIITAEMVLKFLTGFLGEYSLNIPVIFLYWNFLSLSQLEKKFAGVSRSDEISPDSIIKWQLTSREEEISRAILRGDSNKEIASRLKISSSTVKNHIYNIYRKTGASGRIDLLNLLK